jgi:hypothetical protein
MTGKVNATIKMLKPLKVRVELWDVDVLVDDKIQTKEISDSGPVEFIFSTSDTGEFNPELQLRVSDIGGNELHRTPVNKTINAIETNKVTGFKETTTIDFGIIEI